MERPSGIVFIFLLLGFLTGNAPGGRSGPAPSPSVAPTQVVRIPVAMITTPDTSEIAKLDPVVLVVSPGATDELPEGPNGFDVFDDGTLLITDPLRSSVSVFDARGKFREVWKVGFSADSVTVVPNGTVLIREARTGQVRVFDGNGRERSQDKAEPPPTLEARVLSGKSGLVMRPSAGGLRGGPLTIQFENAGSTLVSLESLATDTQGNTYVAMETAGEGTGDEINVSKRVRKYSADGKLSAEIADLPLDYYIPPVNELRVHGGLVYQLFTTKSEVRINVWNTNQRDFRSLQ